MILETHLHTSAGSPCGTVKPEMIPEIYSECGYDGVVVTEHYNANLVKHWFDSSRSAPDCFFEGFKRVERAASGSNLKIFFGMEIGLISPQGSSEYMLYGFTPDFIYDNPELYNLTQRELFEKCCERDILMYQTHPLRDNIVFGNPTLMHGIEVFNGHPGHNSRNAQAYEQAERLGLIKMSGTDFHDMGAQGKGGIFIPYSVNSQSDICRAIKSGKYSLIIK